MDLLDENRSLIHTCKLLRQPETGFEWSGWSELFVLLFDNYREFDAHGNALATDNEGSGHDEAKGKGWDHQVPR